MALVGRMAICAGFVAGALAGVYVGEQQEASSGATDREIAPPPISGEDVVDFFRTLLPKPENGESPAPPDEPEKATDGQSPDDESP